MKSGSYIHIPFCKQACTYCDFHFSTGFNTLEPVIDAILREIKLQERFLNDSGIQTLYFGGGTPSIIPTRYIGQIVDAIDSKFKLSELKEFTLEANPDDMNLENLKAWKDIGVNRFSIGIQSFQDSDLRFMNRTHNAMQSEDCIKRAQDAGFENLSLDLIYGTPGLTDELWAKNLEKIKELQIPHLSTYALTVEEKTPLWGLIRKGAAQSPVEEAYDSQFKILQDFLAINGFEHYEISNSAKPGHRAIHNSSYWAGNPYYGFGPSAHGYDGEYHRYSNIAHNVKYARFENPCAHREVETLTGEDRINEYVLTRLRVIEGIHLPEFEAKFGKKRLQELVQKTKTTPEEWFLIKDDYIAIKPEFKLLSDGISSKLFC